MQLTKAQLRRLTDDGSWGRGVGYFEDGRVKTLLRDGDGVIARVGGTRDYTVTLCLEDGELDGECSCPMGNAGVFCKHCVAVGLEYIQRRLPDDGGGTAGGSQQPRRRPAGPVTSVDDVRAYLARQEKPALVEMLVNQAKRDETLLQRLLMKTAQFRPGGPDIDAFREAIDQAAAVDDYIDYQSAYDFAQGVMEVIDSVAKLLADGHAGEVVELTEYAMRKVGAIPIDDSDGWLDGAHERLQDLHHEACVAARPDPEALARRLFQSQMTGDSDAFAGGAEAYADVLGAGGLAAYRKLAEAEWAKLPQLAPGPQEDRYDDNRYRITAIMESLARADGDVEALVAIKSRDLSEARDFLEIAEIYREAREFNKAMQWAERGLKAFPDQSNPRLRELLANEYHRRKRHDEAMELIWPTFADRVGLDGYQMLKAHADRCGQWPAWRTRALEHVHKTISRARKKPKQDRMWLGGDVDHSLPVEIHLWEGDPESAWDEAQVGGCSDQLWLKLAGLREQDHPEDAVEIYRARIEPLVECTNNTAYRDAVGLLRKVRRLMKRLDRLDELTEYVQELRTKYKRKRNFIAMLAEMR